MMFSIPYIGIAFIVIFLYLNEKRVITVFSTKNAQRLTFVVILLFIGLRGHIYSDFINYFVFFQNLPSLTKLTASSFTDWYFEPGFTLYSSILKTICPNYYAWVFINTFIDLLVFNFVFKRYTKSRILPILFFLAFNGLYIEFNLYRNVKAIDLFLLSLPYLEKRRLVPYMALNILGMTFHTTSIIYLPLYYILNRELPQYIKWGGIIMANMIFLGGISVINDFINSLDTFQALRAFDSITKYTEKSEMSYGITFGYIERTFGMIIFTLLYPKLCVQSPSNRIFYNCFWLYYVSFLFFYEVQVLTERIPILFMFSYWILYPNSMTCKYKYRQFIYTAAVILAFLKIYSANLIPPAKYDNLLFGIEDYHSRKQTYESYVDNHL